MQHLKKTYSQHQSGFTLLELMVALTLGLIVSGIAIQLAISGQRGVSDQQAYSNIQSDALFGLEAIMRDIRLSNLNASESMINDQVLHGGIVFALQNITSKYELDDEGKPTSTIDIDVEGDVLSAGQVDGSSNLAGQKSDRLVIQYRNVTEGQFDCEGRQVPVNSYVMQKYHVVEVNAANEPNQPYALACKAFTYTGDTPEKVDLSGDGQILIPRIDHFSVLLGVAQDTCTVTQVNDGRMSCFGYISIDDYNNITTIPKPQVVSVKLGVLVRSTQKIKENNLFSPDKEYELLHVKAKLAEDENNQFYMRQSITQTIALRNGFGVAK